MSSSSFPSEITISEYILARVKQLNVKSIFGVPGDFNLEFLDFIEDDESLDWVANANELNAAYSADGYARVSKNLAVLCTTFGVGELSALCGVAGMMSERLPLLHIVGTPSTKLVANKALLHHTLGEGKFGEFAAMSAQISAHTLQLSRSEGAGQLIDELIKVAIRECRPVYLTLPTDLIHAKISSSPLNQSLPDPNSVEPRTPSPDFKPTADVEDALDKIVKAYEESVDPCVLVDACASRFGMESSVRKLVDATEMTFFETPMGKAVMDETSPRYGGCYIGENSLPAVKELVEKADLILSIGGLKSDFNTGSFSYKLKAQNIVELHSDHTKIGYATYPGLSFRVLLPLLTARLSQLPKKRGSDSANKAEGEAVEQRKEAVVVPDVGAEDDAKWGKKGVISQRHFWPRVAHFFKEHDIIVAETGTSAFGILDIPYPKTAMSLAQVLWGAIGWSVGATLGAALAARESAVPDRRTILFVGDGSLQLTLQEIGTMVKRGVKPFLFVLNNDGYEIERAIHGREKKYNDIQPYNHSLLLDFLSPVRSEGDAKPHRYHKIQTRDELDTLLCDPDFNKADTIQLIEVFLPRGDVPRALAVQAELTAQANANA